MIMLISTLFSTQFRQTLSVMIHYAYK